MPYAIGYEPRAGTQKATLRKAGMFVWVYVMFFITRFIIAYMRMLSILSGLVNYRAKKKRPMIGAINHQKKYSLIAKRVSSASVKWKTPGTPNTW